MIIQVRGLNFSYHSKFADLIFAAISDFGKITLTSDSQGYFKADADTTKNWIVGRYTYQIISAEKILEQGEMIVKENFALDDATPYSSYWRKVLKTVEDRIAGKSVDAANDVTVGDKKISYMNLDELFKLRNFALQKVAEEDEEEGIETSSPNSEKRISFIWSGR